MTKTIVILVILTQADGCLDNSEPTYTQMLNIETCSLLASKADTADGVKAFCIEFGETQ